MINRAKVNSANIGNYTWKKEIQPISILFIDKLPATELAGMGLIVALRGSTPRILHKNPIPQSSSIGQMEKNQGISFHQHKIHIELPIFTCIINGILNTIFTHHCLHLLTISSCQMWNFIFTKTLTTNLLHA